MPTPILALPLIIEERQGFIRCNEPVTVGVPLPPGAVTSPDVLSIYDNKGDPCATQSEVLARWFDGSIRWLLLDFHVSVGAYEQVQYQLNVLPLTMLVPYPPPLTVQQWGDTIEVQTGEARFTVPTRGGQLLARVGFHDHDLLAAEGSRLVLTDADGQPATLSMQPPTLRTQGSLRTTIHIQGEAYRRDGAMLAHYQALLSFYAGHPLMQLQLTLRNPHAAQHPGGLWDLGDPGSLLMQDLAWHLPLASQTGLQARWSTRPDQAGMTRAGSDVSIYQDSSGGDNWQSSNHVNRLGEVRQTFQGYRVVADGVTVEEGKRATPLLALHDGQGGMAVTLDKFWQNFPKALDVNGRELIVRFFPRHYNDVYELQGGEQKTHTLYLVLTEPSFQTQQLGWLHARLHPRTTPEWYVRAQAFYALAPYPAQGASEGLPLVETAIKGPNTFAARREIIDEYGWRHFGDVYADHEAVRHPGPTPLVSHYNNQYDMLYGALIHYVRSGDERWFALAQDCARHVIDIDIYHTQDDRPAYNGGLFWHSDHYTDAGTATHRTYSQRRGAETPAQSYGGGPANEHNYTTGLLAYYLLTGDEAARETVQGLADWVLNMDTGTRRWLGRFDRRPTGLASSTAHRSYHGPGRGAGNSINALLDAYVLTHEATYLTKAEQLIRRCINPRDRIEDHGLDDVENRWSYTVFLQSLGKYLALKNDMGVRDQMASYARVSLLHYATWMATHERPATRMFERVKLPTETWPAQDVRKSHVFYLAATYAYNLQQRQMFQEKGEFFLLTCLQDLERFSTRTLARPLIILLTNAYMVTYAQHHLRDAPLVPMQPHNFGRPRPFTPQFAELHRLYQIFHRAWAVVRGLTQRAGRGERHG